VAEGDVVFNYRLKEGKATTRNAIKLLELMGYDRDVIERATAQAEHFTESGVWQNVID
jgi:DNA mismatch repair ATPase MutS